ncbi:MAG: DUF4279 domain-containing protein [Planctomycetaceae bacterium]|nr:DUF4279 domain-containing protein [Planctomycetaceae bacterium]
MLDPPFREPPKYDPNTPGIVVGGPVDDVSITLRIFGDDLDPEEITALFRVQPTSSCKKGDVFRGKHYDRLEKTGKWLYAKDHVQDNLDTIVRDLLANLPDDLTIWTSITDRFSVDLFLGVWMRDWNRGFDLKHETLKHLSDRRLEIGFDIYCDTTQPELDIHDIG